MNFNNIIMHLITGGVLMIILMILPTISLAQGAPPATPIDGGLSLLLTAGSVYGIKKIRDLKKRV